MSKYIHMRSIVVLCLLASFVFSNARVAFSRPGSILRQPGVSKVSPYNQYIIGFSGEATHYKDLNYSSAAYLQAILANGYHVGLSYNTNHKFF